MKRINLSKYGFEHRPECDFIDDGHRFQVYGGPGVKVTKLVSDGYAYISGEAQIDDRLVYSEYSSLPHYKTLDKLNGVHIGTITEEDLEQLYSDCYAYASEWEALASTVDYPDYDTIWCMVNRQHHAATACAAEVRRLCTLDAIAKLNDYELNAFRDAAVRVLAEACFNVDDRAASLVGTRKSREMFALTDAELVKPSYWYERCMTLLKKA
jgi:hypothetical protein